MSITARTRRLSIREPEDNAFGRTSSPITVSTPPFKRPRGRPRKKPLQSEKPRTALAYKISEQVSQGEACQGIVGQEQVGHGQIAYKISDPETVSTSKPIIAIPSSSSLRALRSAAPADPTTSDNVVHKLGKKRKRFLSEEVRPTDLRTVCEGCGRRSYPHGENLDETLVIICYKCKKDWHALCIAKEGIKSCDVPDQWECCNCSREGNPSPSQPAHTDDTQAEVMIDQQADDAANKIAPSVLGLSSNIVTEELYIPRMTEAKNGYKEARGRLSNALSERETCREGFYKSKSEIERFGHELEEHRRHFHSDGDAPGNGESQLSITQQQLVLEISGDRDWTDKVSAKFDQIMAEEARLTERVNSLREDVKLKKAALKGVKQQRSRYSTWLDTSCRALEKLRSIITVDFEENSAEDSDTSSESTMEDSIADLAPDTGGCETTQSANVDISPNGIARGIERPAEAANQQHMLEPPQLRSQRSLIVVLRYTPATKLARASNICGIAGVLEQLEKADETEIRGSSQPLETDRVPEQPDPFNAAEAIDRKSVV